MTYQDIAKVNKDIKTTSIKGKQYAEVNERVTAFRKLYPEGSIVTEILSVDEGRCVMRATVSTAEGVILGTGTACEERNASMINKTSYIENCETSAIGRALGMCGIGIAASIASAEELLGALAAQEAAPAPAPVKAPAPEQKPAEGLEALAVCADCGEPIASHGKYTPEAIARKTYKTYGRMLCWDCAEKAMAAMKEAAKSDA
jgi:hypothetical protein